MDTSVGVVVDIFKLGSNAIKIKRPTYNIDDSSLLLMTNDNEACIDPAVCPENFGANVTYRNVYPPVEAFKPQVLAVICAFFVCFVVGLCGNASVLTLICGFVRQRRGRPDKNQSDIVILYIAALCVVDFLMSLSLPPAIVDSIVGFWLFGTVVCKIHHVFGSVGRIASTFIITAMSFDRYVAVCYPHQFNLRSRRTAVVLLATLAVAAVLLLMPMLIHAEAVEVLVHSARKAENVITRVRVFKCSDMMPPTVFYWFTVSTFVFGYLVPLVLIVGFNAKMITQLYARNSKLQRSAIPLRRVTIYTALIAVCYFVCWTPYWASVMYAIVQSMYGSSTGEASDSLLYIIYCIHLLPYVNSASNWILYGRLNTQLQQSNSSRLTEGSVVSAFDRSIGGDSQSTLNQKQPLGGSVRSHSLAVPDVTRNRPLLAHFNEGHVHANLVNGLINGQLQFSVANGLCSHNSVDV
uniref:G-protein coupled receptors family 1 profile domain-containing protein n=1 Tax=Plectus sambesii TaxID=2011161 RepID=A0A914UVN2_9BILA